MKILERLVASPIEIKKNATFSVIILRCATTKNSYNGEILGLSLPLWLKLACKDLDTKIIDYDDSQNVLDLIKSNVNKRYDYTIVLLSKTPLIKSDTIEQIKEFAIFKSIKCCKLPQGYVINNSFIKSLDVNLIDSVYSQNMEDFYIVENKKQLDYALNVLQERINSFHISNGVDLKNPSSIYIEPLVDIESGAIIYPGNTLRGECYVGSNVILKENNVIENSKIGENSCISGSVVLNSNIEDNVYISAFCDISNCKVGKNSTIGGGCVLIESNILNGSKIQPHSIIGEKDDSNSGVR